MASDISLRVSTGSALWQGRSCAIAALAFANKTRAVAKIANRDFISESPTRKHQFCGRANLAVKRGPQELILLSPQFAAQLLPAFPVGGDQQTATDMRWQIGCAVEARGMAAGFGMDQ